ncbi:MAG: cytochrome C [Desulfobacterales bacterium]|nr:MAG: cytochrome C [Desulfobacterales bacterium]
MNRNRVIRCAWIFWAVLVSAFFVGTAVAHDLTPIERLGKFIFFDKNLSINRNQSCAACHAPQVGWTGPEAALNKGGAVYEGSIAGRFGNRKPPSSAYATLSPILHYQMQDGEAVFIGGNFWDGRATGERLGNPAADQAQGPFLNPLEQALPDSACVVYRVCTANYPVSFQGVWGAGACDIEWPADVETVCATEGGMVELSDDDRAKSETAYDNIALSIAAYEDSFKVNAFTSKFDYYLAGKVRLTVWEKWGLRLFTTKGKCANCHTLDPAGPDGEPLFTDFTYDNLGVPRNPHNPFYNEPTFNPDGKDWVDEGLGGFLATRSDYKMYAEENYGKQKVPTVRNVDKRPSKRFVKAYGHNGYFKSLWGIVHFYNTRDVKPVCPDPFTTEAKALCQGCWPEPEVAANVNTDELGNLGLNTWEEIAIVAFLKTLSDGYQPSWR